MPTFSRMSAFGRVGGRRGGGTRCRSRRRVRCGSGRSGTSLRLWTRLRGLSLGPWLRLHPLRLYAGLGWLDMLRLLSRLAALLLLKPWIVCRSALRLGLEWLRPLRLLRTTLLGLHLGGALLLLELLVAELLFLSPALLLLSALLLLKLLVAKLLVLSPVLQLKLLLVVELLFLEAALLLLSALLGLELLGLELLVAELLLLSPALLLKLLLVVELLFLEAALLFGEAALLWKLLGLLAEAATRGLVGLLLLKSAVRSDVLRGDGDGRGAMVGGVELGTIRFGGPDVLALGLHGGETLLVEDGEFRRARADVPAAGAVVADAVLHVHHGHVVLIHGVDGIDVDPVHDTVVVEAVAVPVAAGVAVAGVAEAIGNASIEADVATPITVIEAVAVAFPAPVGWGPESTVVGGRNPGSGNPVVAAIAVVPVAGGPLIVGIGKLGLLVDGERGRGLLGVDGLLIERGLAGVDRALVVLRVGTGVVVLAGGSGRWLGVVLLRLVLGIGLRVGLSAGLGLVLGTLTEDAGGLPRLALRGVRALRVGVADGRKVGEGGIRALILDGAIGHGAGLGVLFAACEADGQAEAHHCHCCRYAVCFHDLSHTDPFVQSIG